MSLRFKFDKQVQLFSRGKRIKKGLASFYWVGEGLKREEGLQWRWAGELSSGRELIRSEIQKSQHLMLSSKTTVALLALLVVLGAQNCPQLCSNNCSNATCSSCRTTFALNAPSSSLCACPPSTFLSNSSICIPCPVTCLACSSYSRCSSCLAGFILSNGYSCIPAALNANGWASKNVSYELAASTLLASNLLVTNGNTSVTLAQAANVSIGCSKLSGYSWLGGYGVFGYSTKLTKSLFSLPPHQWLHVRFQAVLIDKWTANTLLLQLSSNESNSGEIVSPQVIWQESFSYALRFVDFCGNSSIPDNLAVADAWAAHNFSSAVLRIRLNESEVANTTTANLPYLYFAVRELFVRVGTCGKNCKYCSGPAQCTECFLPYTLSNGTCLCNSSLGFLTASGCQANCPPGFYFRNSSTNSSCVSCEYLLDNCETCNASLCRSCALGYFLYKGDSPQCLKYCPSGFTETRNFVDNSTGNSSVVRDQCTPCPANCNTCNGNICIFCLQGFLYSQGSCVASCPSATTPSLGSCVLCPANCASCSDPDTCLTCAQGYALTTTGCSPYCLNTTALPTTNRSCGFTCAASCLSCFGPSANHCLSCANGYLQSGQCLASCNSGYYPSAAKCLTCPHQCASCTTPQNCLICSAGYYLATSNNVSACVRVCSSGSFPSVGSSSTNSSQCVACSSGCQRCMSASFCLECQEGYYRFNFTCTLTLPLSYYYSWEFGHFKPCQNNCLRCNGVVCYRCASGFFLNQGACVTDCGPSKYKRLRAVSDDPTQLYGFCDWKSPTCEVYDGLLGSCSKCSYFQPSQVAVTSNNVTACRLSCPQFYTQSGGGCVACPANCRRCTASLQCLQCLYSYVINAAELITSNNATCVPNYCEVGFFSDSVQCQKCNLGCGVCQMDGRCLSCLSSYSLSTETGICYSQNCTLTQFQRTSDSSCQPCIAPCLTCISTIFCTSCIQTLSKLYLLDGNCLTACPTAYFLHSSGSCRKCNPQCESCSSFDRCLTCASQFYLLSFYDSDHPQCVAECPIGFYSDTQTCQTCFRDCQSCYGASEFQCLTCYPNFALDEGKCVWRCGDGKYEREGVCEWCDSSCNECNGPTFQNCISCGANYYIMEHACYKGSCPDATYLARPSERICEACQFGCSTCNSPHFCRYCFPGYSLYRGWCYLKCPGSLVSVTHYFSYLGGTLGYICQNCLLKYSSKCLACNRDSCTKCAQGYYLYKNSLQLVNGTLYEKCVASCPLGTYVKSRETAECVACQPNCLNCTSYQTCVSCAYPFNLVNGYCSSSCAAGYYLTAYVNCSSCPSNCLTCVSSTSSTSSCTSCSAGYFLFYNSSSGVRTCVSSCPTAYFGDLNSGWCSRCLPTCSSCSATNNCTVCLSGNTFSNGLCLNQTSNCTANCQLCSVQNCLKCIQPYLLYISPTTFTSSCVSACPQGYFPKIFTCESCNASCAACTNSPSNCSQCQAGLFLLGQSCIAVCPVGYYASSALQTCQLCSSNCLNCQASTCYGCQAGYFLYSGQCYAVCPTGTYASVSTGVCYPCQSGCLSCLADQNCTSCASGYLLFNSSCSEVCPLTTYTSSDNLGNSICLPCPSPCYTCSEDSTCISCIPNYILNGTQCQSACSDGYYSVTITIQYENEDQDYDFTNFTQCYPCDPSCSLCSTSATACQACNSPYILYGSQCLLSCPSGTYLSGSSCVSCPSFCVACSTSSSCQVCANSTVLYYGQCIQSCPTGFFISSQGNSSQNQYSCLPCSSSCRSCSGPSSYQCLTCNSSLYLTSNGDCLSTCPLGSYANSQQQSCSPCPYGCSQCLSFSNCTACITNYTLTTTSQCKPNANNCTATNCLFCSANTSLSCAQCVTNYYLYNSSCVSTCPTATYPQYRQCYNCPTNCLTCTASSCLSCSNATYYYQGSCISTCPAGSYASQGVCQNDPCLTYNTTSNDCLLCASPYLLLNQTTSSGDSEDQYQVECVLSCPTGTFQSGSACLPCPQSCLNCLSPSICLNCSSGAFLYESSCQFTCPLGTYAVSSLCKPCSLSFCSQCVLVNGVQSCTSCVSSSGAFLANGVCVLQCPSGTYSDSNSESCKNCSLNCGACSSLQSCTSCNASYYLYLGQCILSCPVGTFADGNSCSSCSTGCTQCATSSNCTSCQSTYSLLSGQCVSACPLGYYSQAMIASSYSNSNQFICYPCASPCLTCLSATACTQCVSNTYLYGTVCVYACPSGYFGTSSQSVTVNSVSYVTNICKICSPPCLTCTSTATYCLSCAFGYLLDSSNNCYSYCASPTSYYNTLTRTCNNCSALCYTCYGSGSDNCFSCRPPLQLYLGSCLSTCPFGYYATAAYSCQQCSSLCASCQGTSSNCSLCSSGLYLLTINGVSSCSSACLDGYYANSSTQTCVPCISPCLTCSSSTQCTSCPTGLYMVNQSCVSSCPQATTLISTNNQQSCSNCPSNCVSCTYLSVTQQLSCTQCASSYYLVNGNCSQSCPSGTYPSLTAYSCTNCGITGCLSCTLNSSLTVSCVACQASFYLYNGLCLSSCPTGTVLTAGQCTPQPTCQNNQWNGYCLTSCPTGTYPTQAPNSSLLTCANCSALCRSCASSNICQSCVSNTFLYSVTSNNTTEARCVTVCPVYYYNLNGTCQPCLSPCLACLSGTSCVTCMQNYYLVGSSCVSVCPAGYYQMGSTCSQCSSICASCSGNSTNCTLCKNTNASPPKCDFSVNCTSGQYQSSNTTCSSCDASCLTCFGSSSYECLSCSNSSAILISGSCLSNCPSATIRNGSSCLTCPSNCLNCTLNGTSLICSVCTSPYLLATVNGSRLCVQSCSALSSASQSYVQVNGQCQVCNISWCILCAYSGGQFQCSACSNATFLYNQQCVATCPSGTTPTSSTCTPCSSNCQQCTSSGCTVCGNGTYLLNGACVSSCGLGYYSANSTCYQCSNSNCLNCSSNGCLSCQSPYLLDSSGGCSSCISGYFFSSGLCQACSSQCLTCVGSASNCTTCAGGLLIFNSSTCVANCPTGYYQTAGGSCVVCSVSYCETCSMDGCISCQYGLVLVVQGNQTSCQNSCPSSMYLSSTTNKCINCSSSCVSCSSSTSCSSCSSPSVLSQGYCISACPSGSYQVNQTCVVCPSGCKRCVSATNCSSCNSGFILSTNGSCSVPQSNCSSGYYLNSLNSCSQCFSTCKTCFAGNANSCSSCFSGYTLTNGVCYQDCASNSFFNANGTCQLCSTAFANCVSCSSSSCLVCATNYTTSNGSCTESCPAATFLSNNNCISCPAYCLICSSSTSCSACLNSSILLVNGLCYTQCPDQTYLLGSSCVSCYQSCLTCYGESTNCSGCVTPYSLNGNKCTALCPTGTYTNNYVCYNCSSNCLQCTSINGCKQCASSYYILNGTCRTVCPSGYYIDSQSKRCLQCVPPCLVCTSRTNCSSCQPPSTLRNGLCVNSNCSGGYYDDSLQTCVNCTINHCSSCTNISCDRCISGYYSIYISGVFTYCAQACIVSTYADNATMNCSSCFSNCRTCLNSTWCTSCSSGYYMLSVNGASANECVSVCPLGYFANTTSYQCVPCATNCNSCGNASDCTVCTSNYYLLTSNGTATCVKNCPTYYYTPTTIDGTGSCGQCANNCYACIDALTCTQCLSSTYVIVNGVCTPSNCVRCLTCNSITNACVQCTTGYYLFNNGCLASCPDGYYANNMTGQCLSCVSNCLLCQGPNSCLLCISGYVFVNGTGCENAGLIQFGTLGNMSGFTSNITRIMAIVYVSTSSGPIAFGAIGSTYGPMQSCQFMYLLQGSTGGNQEVNNFLNSLSAVSYTSNSGTNDQSSGSSSSSQGRRLTAVSYTSTFLQTNLPIFLIMIAFVAAYVIVLIIERYNAVWFRSCPNFQKYLDYVCDFMKRRFKFIYVDCVMWISYLPFLYFAILQLKANSYSSGLEVFSSLLAILIVVVYPLYPVFILRKLFDRGDDLRNYKTITLKLPEREDQERSMCQDLTCCAKEDPNIQMVEMSLSPYIDKVVRPVYNEDIPEYSQFRYFKIEHWRLAYAPIKYVRKFIYVMIVALCPDPVTTLSLLIVITVAYMAYLIVLKPKQKLYLILQLLLESVLLFFIVFMLIYVTQGGAAVSSLSIVTHAIGFIIANSALAIAIILNLMSYYTIFCCIVDLIKHLRNRAIEDDEKMKQFDEIVDDKEKMNYKDKDKEDMEIRKSLRRGDDEATVENNQDEQNYIPYDFDEKEFNIASNLVKKNTNQEQPEDFTNLKSTNNPKARANRKEKKKERNLDQESHTSEEIMAQSKVSDHQIEDGLLKDRNSKFKREVNKNDVNVERGQVRQPTDKFRRNRNQKESLPQEHQSMDALRADNKRGRQPVNEFIADIETHDRMMPGRKAEYLVDPTYVDRQPRRREKRNEDPKQIDEPYIRQRQGSNQNANPNDLNQPTLYDRQNKQPRKARENEKELQSANMIERQAERRKKDDPFGLYDVDPQSGDMYNRDPTAKNPQNDKDPANAKANNRDKNRNDLNQANTYDRQPDNRNRKGKKEDELQSGKMVDRLGRKQENPFGEFEEIFANEDKRAIKQAEMEQRRRKEKESLSNQKLVSGFIVEEGNTVERKNQAKKFQNLLYKGSDEEEVAVNEGQVVEVSNKFRRNLKQPQNNAQPDINAVAKDIKTNKLEKLQSLKQFAEDDINQPTFNERQGKAVQKKPNEKEQQSIDEATGYTREKRIASKTKKEQQQKVEGANTYISPSPVKPNKKPNIYGDLEDVTQSIEFKEGKRMEGKPKAPKDDDFQQQQNGGRIIKTKQGRTKKIQDNRMQIGQNIEESYEDVVKKNKQQVFKQNISSNNSNLLAVDAQDEFEEINYQRPESKIERPRSRNKDLGLGVNAGGDSEASGDESRDIRKQRHSAIQRLRKKTGTLNVNQNNEDNDNNEVGSDSRRISKIAKQKSRIKGVLNIDNKSEDEDIQHVNL